MNRLEKHNRRRKWFPHVSPDDMEIAMHSAPGDEELIEKFRAEVEKRLEPLCLGVLDIRLDGGETKSLIGSPDYASPTAYEVKRAVQKIKALAQQFGDEQFQASALSQLKRGIGNSAVSPGNSGNNAPNVRSVDPTIKL